MKEPISFFVAGIPKGQPRPRAFARKFGAKFSARMYDPGTAEEWKGQVANSVKLLIPPVPIECPLALKLNFFFPRPKKHRRSNGELKPNAPLFYTQKPDADNVAKAVMDALTMLGMWNDDSQICRLTVTKHFALQPGVQIEIKEECA